MNQLQIQLEQIGPLHQPSMDMAVRRWNSIAKPLNSLGLLEKTITQIAGITGNHHIDSFKTLRCHSLRRQRCGCRRNFSGRQ